MTLTDFVALLDDLTAEDLDALLAAFDPEELDRAQERLTAEDFQRLLADHDQYTEERLRSGAVPVRVTVH